MSFHRLHKWILILLLGCYQARIVHCTGGSGDSSTTSPFPSPVFSLGSGSTSQDTPSSPPSQSTNLTRSTNATTNDSNPSEQAHSSDDESELPPALKALAARCELITQTGVTFETHKGEDCATKLDDNTLKFELPGGIKCVEFKLDGKSIWQHDSNVNEDYPESIKLTSKSIEICYSDSSIKYPLSDAKSEPLPAPSTETPTEKSVEKSEPLPVPLTESPTEESENQTLESLPPVTFTVVTAESVYGKNPAVNDATKYEMKEENGSIEYMFKHGAYCVELKAGDCSIWTHSLSKEGIELPKIITINKATYDVMVKFENFLTYFYKHKLVEGKSTWILHQVKDLDKFYISKLKLLNVDPTDPKKTNELHKFKYTVTCDGDLCYYELKPGSCCSRIDYDGEPVWRYSLSEYGFPKSLFLDVTLKLLLMEFEKVTCAYSISDDSFPHVTSKPSESAVLSVDNLQIITHDPDDHTELEDHPNIKITGSKINDKTMYDLKTVGGSKPFSKIYFKPEAKCDMVTYNYELIWEHDKELHGDMYPKAVYLITLNNTVVVWFSKNLLHAYKLTSKGWHLELEDTKGCPKLLELDVDLEEYSEPLELNDYQGVSKPTLNLMVADDENATNLRKNDSTTYFARRYFYGYTFKFKKDKFCHEVKYGKKSLWKYDASLHRGHFPTQVDLDAGDPDTDEPEMIKIVLTKDWYYVYEYEVGDFVLTETWEPLVPLAGQEDDEDTSQQKTEPSTHLRSVGETERSAVTTEHKEEDKMPQPKQYTTQPPSVQVSEMPDGLKIFAVIDAHPNDHKENDFSMFNLFKYGPVFECAFKRGVKCTEIKYNGLIVWSARRILGGLHSPTALYFDDGKPPMVKVFFKDDWNYTYKFSGAKWILRYSRTEGMLGPLDKVPVKQPCCIKSRIAEFLQQNRPEPTTPSMTNTIPIPFKKYPSEIKVYTFKRGDAVLNIDDESLYEVRAGSVKGNVFKYKFSDGVKCVKLMFGHIKVWEHDPNEHGESYPTEIYYARDVKIVTISFTDKWFYTYQLIDSKFKLTESRSPKDEVKELVDLNNSREDVLKAKEKELETKRAELDAKKAELEKKAKELEEALRLLKEKNGERVKAEEDVVPESVLDAENSTPSD